MLEPSEAHNNDLVSLQDVTHVYSQGSTSHCVLRDVSLTIEAGQSCAIIGASGSGKSTLLNLIGLLDEPTTGRIVLSGRDMSREPVHARAIVRNQLLGFVFQSFNLLPRLNVLDNVALPLLYRGILCQQARQQAQKQLARVGLGERSHYRPADLSGGQRQRVAIARALVGEPALLLADEPTGNLDSRTGTAIIDLLLTLNHELGTTLVLVTHDLTIAHRMARCVEVKDGQINELQRI